MSRRGLGKGLDALLGGSDGAKAAVTAPDAAAVKMNVDKLAAGKFQPRENFARENLNSLADSIRQHGVIQPIVVRPVAGGYEIIAGERRWRAAKLAGLAAVPVVVRKLGDDEAQIFALVENLQRADLNPLEQARGIAQLIERTGCTHAVAGTHVGLSRPAVSNLLRLLELAEEVQAYVMAGEVEMGHARALLGLPRARQAAAAREVMAKRMTVRETEQLVRRLLKEGGGRRRGAEKDADTALLEKELADKLAMRVEIRHRKNGTGRLLLHYGSLESLDAALDKLRR